MFSYKKSSNVSFIVFIISVLLTVFSVGRCRNSLYNVNLYSYILFEFFSFMSILAAIISFVCLVCYEHCSETKIKKSKENLYIIYSDGKKQFLDYFKQYLILNLKKNSTLDFELDLNYVVNNFQKFFDEYKINLLKYIKALNDEDFEVNLSDIIPSYIDKIYECIVAKTLPAEEFVDIVNSDNYFIYKNDYKYMEINEQIYVLKDLFSERLEEIDKKILDTIN